METLPRSSAAVTIILLEYEHYGLTRTIMTIKTLGSYGWNVILDCWVRPAPRAVVYFVRFSSMWRFPLI